MYNITSTVYGTNAAGNPALTGFLNLLGWEKTLHLLAPSHCLGERKPCINWLPISPWLKGKPCIDWLPLFLGGKEIPHLLAPSLSLVERKPCLNCLPSSLAEGRNPSLTGFPPHSYLVEGGTLHNHAPPCINWLPHSLAKGGNPALTGYVTLLGWEKTLHLLAPSHSLTERKPCINWHPISPWLKGKPCIDWLPLFPRLQGNSALTGSFSLLGWEETLP